MRMLLTCATDNIASRRVIIANSGHPDGTGAGEDRFWIEADWSKGLGNFL